MLEFSTFLSYAIAAAIGAILGWGLLLWRRRIELLLDLGSGKTTLYVLIAALATAVILSLMFYFGLFEFKPIRDFYISSSYVAAFILGSLFGLTELISRYRDEPRRALRHWAAWFYVLVNALASVFALNIIRVFNWFTEGNSDLEVTLKRVLIAGFGSMILFRSSLFIIRTASGEIPFGPVVVLQILLGAADREVDRNRGLSRSSEIGEIMKNVSFNKAKTSLVVYCLELMQNVPKAEQEALAEKAKSIGGIADITEPQKSMLLGLALLNVVGRDLLTRAVKSLGEEITE